MLKSINSFLKIVVEYSISQLVVLVVTQECSMHPLQNKFPSFSIVLEQRNAAVLHRQSIVFAISILLTRFVLLGDDCTIMFF